MALNEDFSDNSRFEEMLRLLDDANNAVMAQLSGALRSVKRILRQNLLENKFKNYTNLMKYLSNDLNLREHDLTDLAQVGDSLQNIQRVIEDAGKTAAVRDMKILENAMNHFGIFIFLNQKEIQNTITSINNNKYLDNQIGRNCLQLLILSKNDNKNKNQNKNNKNDHRIYILVKKLKI